MEPYLGNPVRCEAVLRRFGFSFRKRFGQNFLIDESVLTGIVEGSGITKEDTVLEIGPGIGSLTQYLASAARRVIAVEIDRSLLEILDDTLSGWDNVRVISSDILKVDLRTLALEENEGRPFKVAANLPYYITTPVLMKLLESDAPVSSITVMVQKEVADRIRSGPGTKDYGALSLAVQYYAEAEVILNVGRNSFIPRPNVDSAVLKLSPYREKPVRARDEAKLFAVIRAAFGQRRKTLANAVANSAGLDYSRDEVRAALGRLSLDENVRGETLTLSQFAALSDALSHEI